jgi:sterol desaturase/sphingolipid hydroxylase (fatty acid hydroxylase superfamily)
VDPPEAAVYAAFIPLVAFLYPLHPVAVVTFMFVQFCCNLAIHAGYEFMPARFSRSRLARFVSSPTSHVQHHETGRGNFGFCFQFWDRLMGTCHPDYDTRLQRTTQAVPAGPNGGLEAPTAAARAKSL